jgi:hypothetical protein
MRGLTEDQKDQLRDFAHSNHWDAMELLLSLGIDKQVSALLKSNLSNGDREVTLLKSRLEGAQALAVAVKDIRKEIMR